MRSLFREDLLSLPEISRRLYRHRSWVWRRLMLVEALDPIVQTDVRLGLLTPRAAVAVSRLPRGNQQAARDSEIAAHSPALVILCTDADDPRTWLQAGQALQRVLLHAHANGLSASFLNQPIEVESLRHFSTFTQRSLHSMSDVGQRQIPAMQVVPKGH